MEGCHSSSSPVTSGVPQGTVLGPLLFLLFINDLPLVLDPITKCRLFADNCLVYREIRNLGDQIKLQEDLNALERWSIQWGMHFNAKKCNTMTIARSTPLQKMYLLDNTILDQVSACTYLGVTIPETLGWEEHVNTIAAKANSCLGFLRINLKGCPHTLKRMSYASLVRSTLEYTAAIWDLHLIKHKDSLEHPQRRAARWINWDYHTRASVTVMLRELRLDPLENRRKASSLTMMFKVLNGHVGIPPEDLGLLPADSRTRENHRWKQQHSQSKTTEFQHSFSVRMIPSWNRLPACVAEAASVDYFKRQLAAVAV